MAILKQGALNQVLAVCVDKTDFATIESGVTSNFTCKLYTVKQGSSAAASTVTLSRVPSVVQSGIIRVTLKAADTSGVDHALLNIVHASCADQNIPLDFSFQGVSNYLSNASNYLSGMSNILSAVYVDTADISDILSQVLADVTGLAGASKSDIASAVWGEKWDVHSLASTFGSAFEVIKDWGVSNVVSALTADVESYLSAYLSDIHSALASTLSDLDSQATANGSQLLLVKSLASDIDSAISSQFTVLIGAGYMSDIVSRIWGEKYNVHSAAASTIGSFIVQQAQGASNLLSNISGLVSDAHSAAILGASHASDAYSVALINRSLLSDIDSAITSQHVVLTGASHRSDIASAVWGEKWDVHSGVSTIGSRFEVMSSDISDLISRITAAVATKSDLISGIWTHATASDLMSKVGATIKSDYFSDALSKVQSDLHSAIGNVSVTLTQSDISDIASAVVAALDNSAIASAVWSEKYNVHSLASSTFGSFVTQQTQGLSNILSAVYVDTADISNVLSNTHADLENLSNIASQILADTTDISNVLSNTHADLEGLSNIASQILADTADISNVLSGVSNTLSAVYVDTTDISNVLSNTHANLADLSNIASQILGDTGTTLDNNLSKVLALFNNKLNITDATGAAALRSIGDGANIATWGITDDDTTTVKTEATWA